VGERDALLRRIARRRRRPDRRRARTRSPSGCAAVIVENRSYEHLLELYDGDRHVFYVDPPYLGSTRSSLDPAKRRGRDYLHDLTTEDQHRELAAASTLEAGVLLSGYHSPLYDELYGDWHTVEVTVQRPSGNRRGHSMPPAVEVVWSAVRPRAARGRRLPR
jgi:DNA adenine methylase